jgi:hypothetical protein
MKSVVVNVMGKFWGNSKKGCNMNEKFGEKE